jgi:hypothetical protein
MAKISYNTSLFGGTMVAEFVDAVIKAKDAGQRLSSILKETTVDGAATTNIAIGGSQEAVFGVESGQGGNFYNALVQASVGIITVLNTVDDDKLANLDMG